MEYAFSFTVLDIDPLVFVTKFDWEYWNNESLNKQNGKVRMCVIQTQWKLNIHIGWER